MSYTKQKLKNGQILMAKHVGLIEDAIIENETGIQELSKTAQELVKSTAGTQISETAKGAVISLTDSAEGMFKGLRVFGKTTQGKTTGAQLFDASALLVNANKSLDVSEDGYTITAIGGNDNAYVSSYVLLDVDVFKGKHITIKADALTSQQEAAQGTAQLSINTAEGTTYHAIDGSVLSISVDIPTEVTELRFGVYTNNTAAALESDNTVTIKGLMITTADAAWEPYTGGIASPNPEYPQELVNLDAPMVKVFDSNIFNINKMSCHANKSLEVTEDGYKIVASGGSDKPYTSSSLQLDVESLRGATLVISADSIENTYSLSNGVVQLNVSKKSGAKEYLVLKTEKLSAEYFVGEDVTTLYIAVYTNNTGSALPEDNIITVEGLRINVETASEWEPYKEPQTLTLSAPNGLPGIPVTSGGNYTDESGQQWICDEVDMERGVYVQNIYKKEFKGTEICELNTQGTKAGVNIYQFYTGSPKPKKFIMYCSHFQNGGSWNNGMEEGSNIAWVTGSVYMFKTDGMQMLEEFKAYLAEQYEAGNPVTGLYAMETPIETPLTEEEIAAYQAAHTNYPTTTILNDAGAGMEVVYAADTQLYHEKVIEEAQKNLAPEHLYLTDQNTGTVHELTVVDGALKATAVTE